MISVRNGFDEGKIARFLQEGRGGGRYENYKPWLTTTDVTARLTRKSRFQGIKSGRVHHLFNDFEANALLCIEWLEYVLDIRERYPLERATTARIADALGITHPVDRKSGVKLTLYADLVVELAGGRLVACAMVYSSQLNKSSVIAALEIQRRYWKQRDITWRIITERQIDPILVHNIEFGRNHVDLSRQPDAQQNVVDVGIRLLERLEDNPNVSLQALCDALDSDIGRDRGTAIAALRHLCGTRRVGWRRDRRIEMSMPAGELSAETQS